MQTKHLVVLALAGLSFASGVAGQYLYPGRAFSPVDFWFFLIFPTMVFWWYHLDTSHLGYKRTVWLNIGVILVAALALPYYFFRSRGLKRGLVATLGLYGAVVVSGLLTLTGQYAAYFGLQG